MNCDRIAPFYRFFEMAAFGTLLQKQRLTFLSAAQGKQRVLILGDGDGRFTQALAQTYPELEIDSIELSARMVDEAKSRIPENIRLIQADIFHFPLSRTSYDLVFTHFFLDCFSASRLHEVITRISEALTPNGTWVISEFHQAASGWRKRYTSIWLATMYLFFKWATGLETQSLPVYGPMLEAAGFLILSEKLSWDGLRVAQIWQRQNTGG
jgi:ubiquinone/menaquinone biosynthesis C-methylase UbiE